MFDYPLDYDRYIFMLSGGKDSIVTFLLALEAGVPIEKCELWHHLVDGREGSDLMDYDITEGYCRAFAKTFNVPIYFSWKMGGFEREMTRNNSRTAPTCFEVPGGKVITIGGQGGKESTRMKFPQISGDLSVRWCSAYLKIDVALAAIRNQERFNGKRTAIFSGERGQENPKRARYALQEPSKADLRDSEVCRYVDHFRPVRDLLEEDIWDVCRRHRIRMHPSYYLGKNRCSCENCIFNDEDGWASSAVISPHKIERIIAYEEDFGVTIHREYSLRELIAAGTPYPSITPELIALANSRVYDLPIFMDDWFLPAGAFKKGSCGPS